MDAIDQSWTKDLASRWPRRFPIIAEGGGEMTISVTHLVVVSPHLICAVAVAGSFAGAPDLTIFIARMRCVGELAGAGINHRMGQNGAACMSSSRLRVRLG